MLRICTRSAVVVLCLVTLATTVAAAARSLAFITIDFPGAILTNAQGINAGGEIVGGYTDTAGRQHGFVLSGGQFQSIDVPNSRSTFARGIGPDGEIVMHRAHRVCVVVAPENGTVRKDSLRDRVDVARKVHGFKLSSAVQQNPCAGTLVVSTCAT